MSKRDVQGDIAWISRQLDVLVPHFQKARDPRFGVLNERNDSRTTLLLIGIVCGAASMRVRVSTRALSFLLAVLSESDQAVEEFCDAVWGKETLQ